MVLHELNPLDTYVPLKASAWCEVMMQKLSRRQLSHGDVIQLVKYTLIDYLPPKPKDGKPVPISSEDQETVSILKSILISADNGDFFPTLSYFAVSTYDSAHDPSPYLSPQVSVLMAACCDTLMTKPLTSSGDAGSTLYEDNPTDYPVVNKYLKFARELNQAVYQSPDHNALSVPTELLTGYLKAKMDLFR